MGVGVAASPASRCRQCSYTAVPQRPQHMQLRRLVGWSLPSEVPASARCWSAGAQRPQPLLVTSALGSAIGGSQPSLRADTALCFASDSVSDPMPNAASDPAGPQDRAVSEEAEGSNQQDSSAPNASGYSVRDLRVLWDSVARPLLRVGRAGEPRKPFTSISKDCPCIPRGTQILSFEDCCRSSLREMPTAYWFVVVMFIIVQPS